MQQYMSPCIKCPLFGPFVFDIFIKGLNNSTESWIIKSEGDVSWRERDRFNRGTSFGTWSIIKSLEPTR